MSRLLPLKILAHDYRFEFLRGMGCCWVRPDYATHGTRLLSLSALLLQMEVDTTRILATFLMTRFCAGWVAFRSGVYTFENPP